MPTDRVALPTVVYVCGVGHSGSTLLDRLLGAREGAWSGGEVKRFSPSRHETHWHAKGWPAAVEEPCACGAARLADCPFWQAVDARLGAEGLRLAALDVYHPDSTVFARDNEALFDAIAQESGAGVVVDSSKDLVRLRRLLAETALPVVPVLVERRLEGVVASEARRGRPWLGTAAASGRALLGIKRFLRGRPHHALSYEALCDDAGSALAPLAEALGLGAAEARTPHLAFGNPMRLRPLGTVRRDDRWRAELTAAQRSVVGALGLPVRRGWTALRPLYRALAAAAR